MIVFVGDKPSVKNVDPDIPFVGTQSYKNLLNWIWEIDIDISDTLTANATENFYYWVGYYGNGEDPHNHVYIALGNKAENFLKSEKLNYFKLPHPSPRNRKLNDKKFIKQELKKCKEWLTNG